MRLLYLIVGLFFWMTVNCQPKSYCNTSQFKVNDGLLQNKIGDFDFDRNGLLWLSFASGLQVFDGQNFIEVNGIIPENEILSNIRLASNGNILATTNAGIYEIDPILLKLVKAKKSEMNCSNSEKKLILFEDENSICIVCENQFLQKLSREDFSVLDVFQISENDGMRSWGLTFPENISRFQYYFDSLNQINRFDIFNWKSEIINPKNDFSFDKASLVYSWNNNAFFIKEESFYIFDGSEAHLIDLGLSGRFSYFPLIASDTTAYLAIENRVFLIDFKQKQLLYELKDMNSEEFCQSGLFSITGDEFGNLYFNPNFGDGLVRISQSSNFTYLGSSEKDRKYVKSITYNPYNEKVLFHGFAQQIEVFNSKFNWERTIDLGNSFAGKMLIRAIHVLDQSSYLVMFSEVNKLGILSFTKDDFELRIIPQEEENKFFYYESFLDLGDKVLLGYDCKLFNKRTKQVIKLNDSTQSYCLLDLEPEIWGGFNNKIRIIDKNKFELKKEFDLKGVGMIRDLAVWNDQIYAGCDKGLIQIDPKTFNYKYLHKNTVVFSILVDDKGSIWCGTNKGILHFDPNNKTQQYYNEEDGIQANEFNTHVKTKLPNGHFLLGGVNGVTAFDPNKIQSEGILPKVVVKKILIDNKKANIPHYSNDIPSLKTDYKSNNIDIEIAALGTKAPKDYNYQYKISGVHENWINLKSNMKISHSLSPGKYEIFYYASNYFTEKPRNPYSFKLSITPPIYATWWFRILSILVFSGLIAYLVNQRNKQKLLQLQYDFDFKTKLNGQRQRISRELHDNVGARLATIRRTLNWVTENHTFESENIKQKLLGLENISKELNQDLREVIWVNNRAEISLKDWTNRLKNRIAAIQAPDKTPSIQIKIDILKDRILNPKEAFDLVRIIQEAIENAIKHASAHTLTILISSDDRILKISIADDGKGFNPDLNFSDDSFGIKNMIQRAEENNFSIKFLSPKKGSEIVLLKKLNHGNQS